jgi:hypothetical protein
MLVVADSGVVAVAHESGSGPLLMYAAKARTSTFRGTADHDPGDRRRRLLTRSRPLVPVTEIERLPQAALGTLHQGIDRAAGHRR